jgi:hypothetical protein
LYPRNDANRRPTGGRCETRAASALGTPWATRPWSSVPGSVFARPRIISEKKIPMESTRAEFWKVVAIPAPAPRRFGGRLFMIPAWLGEAKSPIPRPTRSNSNPNQR